MIVFPLYHPYNKYNVNGSISAAFCPFSTVHGFANASYNVVESELLDTTFQLNVKGTTNVQSLPILGNITSEESTASE